MHSEKFMLSDLPDYYIGEEGDLKHYKEVRNSISFMEYFCDRTPSINHLRFVENFFRS